MVREIVLSSHDVKEAIHAYLQRNGIKVRESDVRPGTLNPTWHQHIRFNVDCMFGSDLSMAIVVVHDAALQLSALSNNPYR